MLTLLAALCLATASAAQPVITTLENGLQVCALQDYSSDVAVVQIIIRAAADCEPASKAGIRTVLQHALKATWDAQADEDAELGFLLDMTDLRAGLTIDTDWEYVSVGYSGTPATIPDALAFLANGVFSPDISQETYDRTINLVKQAAGGPQASPGESTYALFREALQKSVPRAYALGTPKTLENISLADLNAFQKRFYLPNLATVCVLAPMRAETITQLVTERFGDLIEGDTDTPPRPKLLAVSDSKAALNDALAVGTMPQLEIASMVVGVPAPAYDDPDLPVMYVIHAILGGNGQRIGRIDEDEALWGMLGLPFPLEKAKESQFIESLAPPLASPGYLAIHTYVAPRQVDALRLGLVAQFEGIGEHPPGAQELNDAKEYVRNSYSRLFDDPSTRTLIVARGVALGIDAPTAPEFFDRVAHVSAADVKRVAKTYFTHHAVGVEFPSVIEDMEVR